MLFQSSLGGIKYSRAAGKYGRIPMESFTIYAGIGKIKLIREIKIFSHGLEFQIR